MSKPARRLALLVEDDPSQQRSMAKTLRENNFDVLVAFDFATAVDHLSKHAPHIACIDLGLPSESGYELCEYIRKEPRFASLPIMVMSEQSFPEDMAHAEEAGANAFLKKPFPMPRFVKYVLALLDGPYASRPSVRRLRA